MALALLILAHKNAAQVARLFRAVHRPQDVVVLHFDRRASHELHELGRSLARQHRNVVVLPARSILWGGYRMAGVQIDAMAAALHQGADWHHFINLTGQDFPIRPIDELDAKLAKDPDANYVTWFDPLTTPFWNNARSRVDRFYFEWAWLDWVLRLPVIGRRLRKILGWENHLPHGPRWCRRWPSFRFYGGANHVILSRAACTYVTTDPEARRIERWLKYAAHANEIVLQSVLLNSPLAGTIINGHFREIDFPAGSPHPRTFRTQDFDRLIRSPNFIARKFDLALDAGVIEQLERHLAPTGKLPPHQ